MIRLWAEAPDWATHIVAPVGSPDSEMWAELIDGSYYSKPHRIERAKTMDESFILGIVVVSARDAGQADAARIAPPKTIDLSDIRRNGRPPKEPGVSASKAPIKVASPSAPTPPKPAPAPAPKTEPRVFGDNVEVKVSELEGQPLSWAVADALGLKPEHLPNGKLVCDHPWRGEAGKWPIPDYLSDFGRGWLLITAHGINISAPQHDKDCWAAWLGDGRHIVQAGKTPQEAVCRCVVVLRMGQRVLLPAKVLELTV